MSKVKMYSINALDRLWQNQLEMTQIFNSVDDLYDIFTKYIRLRQVSRFFSALFYSLSATPTTNNNCVLFPIKFLKKFIEEIPHLPAGQIVEIWNLCIINASNVLKNIRAEESDINLVHLQLLFEIFRLFILHVKIQTERCVSSINELFKNTATFLKEALEVCTKNHFENQIVFAVLGICHAWGELLLAMNQYGKEFKNPISFVNISHVYDLSGNHYYFSSQNWINIFMKLSDNKESKTHYFIILLLLQKVRTLILGSDNLSELQAVTDVVDYIVKSTKLIEFSDANITWNGEPTYITSETHSVAIWYCILKHIPCLANFLRKRHWSYLASKIIEMLNMDTPKDMLESGQSAFTITKKFLEGPFFSEIRPLQSAYVTELFKLSSEMFQSRKRKLHNDTLGIKETVIWNLYSSGKMWISLANTTPKCKDFKLSNELWERIKQVSDILSNMLQLEEKEKIKLEILYNLLKLMNYLPLEYLLPGNQMRCLLALITVMNCIPSISKKDENISLQCIMIKICKTILAILDGARSIWLLSFIDISLLLKITIQVSCSLLTETSCKEEILKWTRQLLNSFVSLSMKSTSTLISLRDFIKDIVSLLCCNECNEPIVICISVLLSRFNDALRRTHVQQNYESICRENAELLISALTSFIKNKNTFGNELDLECYREFIDFKCLSNDGKIEILNLQKVVQQELMVLQQEDSVLHDVNVTFFTTICKNREILKDCIPDNFAQQLWFSASKLYNKQLWESGLSICCKGIISSLSNLDQIRMNLVKDIIERYVQNSKESLIQQPLTVPNNDETNTISDTRETEILKVSIMCATEEEYKNIVQHTVDLTNSFDVIAVYPILQLWKIIVGSVTNSSHREILRIPVTNLIMKLCCLAGQQKCSSDGLKISNHVLDFCTLVLRNGKGLLIHQSILNCMELCILSPLQNLVCQPKLYICIFENVYNVLNEIMIQHLYCVLCAPSCFLACVSYALSCQIQASNQNIVMQCDKVTQEKLSICAQKLCKLMSLISEYRTEFSKLVATIIASYVNEVEKVTVFPPIKAQLLIGLNKLIKICDHYFLNVLQKTLKHGSKEILKSLLSDHRSYFRYQGHV